MTRWDVEEGDTVTLPDGAKVKVEQLGHDGEGNLFTCIEKGEVVWYYTSILELHPANAPLRY